MTLPCPPCSREGPYDTVWAVGWEQGGGHFRAGQRKNAALSSVVATTGEGSRALHGEDLEQSPLRCG